VDGSSTTFDLGICRTLRNASGEIAEYIASSRMELTSRRAGRV
jgi:hypothetical protein